MEIIDFSRFHGQKLKTIIGEAEKLEKDSLAGKINAHKIYSSCIDAIPTDYSKGLSHVRGYLRRKIWDIERNFGWNFQFYSQAGQDKFVLQEFFKHKKNGFFVEIGAYNGIQGSNCFYFEKFKKWKGVAVEASPTQFKSLKKNRSCLAINKAISDKNGTADFIDVTSGLTQMSGLESDHYKKTYKKIKAGTSEINIIQAKTITLSGLFSTLKIKEIDYCSIDIEGGEYSIMKGFNFSKYPIKVLSFENKEPEKIKFNSILEKNGYKFFDYVGSDEVWYNIRHFDFS